MDLIYRQVSKGAPSPNKNKKRVGAALTPEVVKKVLDAMIVIILRQLNAGDTVRLGNMGSFSVSKRAARTGRNPQTGKEIKIAAKNVVKFKAGKALADKVT